MLMVKNRGKNRGNTGENRAETGPPGQSPQARFIGWFSPRFSPVLPGFARFFYLAAAGCTPSGHLAIQRLAVAGKKIVLERTPATPSAMCYGLS